MMATPLTDKINALTAYANEVTGESDTTLSEAVHTLADGYGQGGGGGDTIWPTLVEHTVTEINDKDGLCKAVGDYAFYNCTSLTSAIFPSVTSIGASAFQNCTALSTVNFPSLTSAGDSTFYGCRKLLSIDMPLLESVPYAFCDNAKTLSWVRLSSATSIRNSAFIGCSKLSSVTLPSVTSLNKSAFNGCVSLPSVNLPNAASIGTYVFNGCTELKALILRKSDAICTLAGTNALNNTPIAKNTGGYIYVPASLIETYKTASNWSTFAAQFRALEDYTVDGTITGDLDPNKI